MITIYSPGGYANNHKPEEYSHWNYESVIRNATIAKMPYLNKSIEQFSYEGMKPDSSSYYTGPSSKETSRLSLWMSL